MSKQYVVTLDSKTVTVQRLSTQVTVPNDAQFVAQTSNLVSAVDALANAIYSDAPAT